MIKKYTLALLAFSSLNADIPTCHNSPEPLSPEQIKYCKNAQEFVQMAQRAARKGNKSAAQDFIENARRQLKACLTKEPTSLAQITHMEAVTARDIITMHKEAHTAGRSTARVAREFVPYTWSALKSVGSTALAYSVAVVVVGNQKTFTVIADGKKIVTTLPANTMTVSNEDGTNMVRCESTDLTIFHAIAKTLAQKATEYWWPNLSTTQKTAVVTVTIAGIGYFVFKVYQDMHEPLPLACFATEEEVNRYMQEHGFSEAA